MSVDNAEPDASDDRPLIASRSGDILVLCLLLSLALVLGWDSYRIGAGWASTGPQAGYFPFYLAVIMGAACLFGLAKSSLSWRGADHAFTKRGQMRRVLQVFVPTLAFVVVTQFLGLYVASFLLVAGFMMYVGKIAVWKALMISLIFTAVMFATFEVAFNVVMPKGPLEAALGY